ncbi:MAG: hypothetical protein R2734_20780 [Nocardioides sp.]
MTDHQLAAACRRLAAQRAAARRRGAHRHPHGRGASAGGAGRAARRRGRAVGDDRGVARDTEVDEVFLVLSGSGRVEFEDGSALALVPVSPSGSGRRAHGGTVTQTLRKVYVAG